MFMIHPVRTAKQRFSPANLRSADIFIWLHYVLHDMVIALKDYLSFLRNKSQSRILNHGTVVETD